MPTTAPHFTIHTQPHSSDGEKTVLGALLLDPEAITKVGDSLQPDDFYDPTYRSVYQAMVDLQDEQSAIDFVTVSDKLTGNEKVERVGGTAFLAELAADVPTSSHLQQYARMVREASTRRRLIAAGERIKGLGYGTDGTSTEALEAAEKEILTLSRQTAGAGYTATGREMYPERYNTYADLYDGKVSTGLPTGYHALDSKLIGMLPGDFVVIAARPSMGKTALAINLAHNITRQQHKQVAFFSLEQRKEKIFDRIFSRVSGISVTDIKRRSVSQEQMAGIGNVMEREFENATGQIHIDDDPNTTLTALRSKARRLCMEHDISLLVIDYLQLMSIPEKWAYDNPVARMTEISKSIKELARELQIPVIGVSQLNRNAETRPGNKPLMADLRESGSLEQDADMVLMLYREAYYDDDCEHPEKADVYIRKNRDGETGHAELRFNKHLVSFGDWEQGTAAANASG